MRHRRRRHALPAHVARAIGPSPARAAPHDAGAWLPLPDLDRLPAISELLAELPVAPGPPPERPISPARAVCHDPAAWLPLPRDLEALPSVDALLDPDPETQAAVVAEAEAIVHEALAAAQAVVAPSPARAAPHDAATWLPLPDVATLPELDELCERPPAPELTPAPAAPRKRRVPRVAVRRLLPPPRALFVALLATATVVAGAAGVQQLLAPGGSMITLVVDGRTRDVRTETKTVGQLLAVEHVQLAAADKVVPGPSTRLHDDLRVHVLRAFPVTVDIDGTTRTVATTSRSVDALAHELAFGARVSVRDAPPHIGGGSVVVFRTHHTGTLFVDGQTVSFDSPSLNVGELLASYKVVLAPDDHSDPPPAAPLVDGAAVTIVRVGYDTVQELRVIPFVERRVPDSHLAIGQTRVVQQGRPGRLVVTYRRQTQNGTEAARAVVSAVPSPDARPRVVRYGTGADWHWDALARCESGGRWDTVDPSPEGYDGGLGIYRGTWKAFGGLDFAPNAGLASREDQIRVGQRIYNRYGWYAWGCARNVLHWV